MKPSGKRILWVDDEIDLLRPHLLFLHGGISPEEMIVPIAHLTPRPRGAAP
jgi:hypothetical protein